MPQRKTYTRQEIDNARNRVGRQLAAYQELVGGLGKATGEIDADVRTAFEAEFATALLLELDRHFVHRLQQGTDRDCTALNEVELLADALLNNDGIVRREAVPSYSPDSSVTGIGPGEPILLTLEHLERLVPAFFAELEAKFLS